MKLKKNCNVKNGAVLHKNQCYTIKCKNYLKKQMQNIVPGKYLKHPTSKFLKHWQEQTLN